MCILPVFGFLSHIKGADTGDLVDDDGVVAQLV